MTDALCAFGRIISTIFSMSRRAESGKTSPHYPAISTTTINADTISRSSNLEVSIALPAIYDSRIFQTATRIPAGTSRIGTYLATFN